MGFLNDRYRMDDDGNFDTADEAKRAESNGHIQKTSSGYWDKDTGDEYWEDGTKKE